jgi:hypothetical protein
VNGYGELVPAALLGFLFDSGDGNPWHCRVWLEDRSPVVKIATREVIGVVQVCTCESLRKTDGVDRVDCRVLTAKLS